MKKLIVFALAIVGLTLVACNETNKDDNTTAAKKPVEGGASSLNIAIINLDTIMSRYLFAVDANESLLSKAEDARVNLNQSARALENEMAAFQKKVDNNGFMSRERAEQEAQRLQKKQYELERKSNELGAELQEKQAMLSMQLQDSVDNALKILNADGKYNLIISNSTLAGSVMYNDPEMDITEELVTLLNSRIEVKNKK